jgi:hypothetical protein
VAREEAREKQGPEKGRRQRKEGQRKERVATRRNLKVIEAMSLTLNEHLRKLRMSLTFQVFAHPTGLASGSTNVLDLEDSLRPFHDFLLSPTTPQ